MSVHPQPLDFTIKNNTELLNQLHQLRRLVQQKNQQHIASNKSNINKRKNNTNGNNNNKENAGNSTQQGFRRKVKGKSAQRQTALMNITNILKSNDQPYPLLPMATDKLILLPSQFQIQSKDNTQKHIMRQNNHPLSTKSNTSHLD